MKTIKVISAVLIVAVALMGCKKKDTSSNAMLVFNFKFDSTQTRLNNLGQPAAMPAGHAGQSPTMNVMAAHYIELAPDSLTLLGKGQVLYQTPMTTAGGDTAIDFQQETLTQNGGTFYQVPIKNVTPGTYQYLRVSLAYQNYGVQLYIDTTAYGVTIQQNYPCTVASFIGVNSYITNYKIDTSHLTVNGNRKQGYWGFESVMNFDGFYTLHLVDSGQAPAGATTVVNPIFDTSPIPSGSCVVTGAFNGGPLKITGSETNNIVVTVSLSTQKSFEWIDVVPDGYWEPTKGESIVDMGIRGMIPYVQY